MDQMMSPREIEKRTEQILTPIAAADGCRVYDVDYAREGQEWYLTCYIDKDGGVTLDDCETVNRAMSDALDQDDFIGEPYTLIVSSPGLGRKLTKDRHFLQSLGQEVEGTTYQPVVLDPRTAAMLIEAEPDGTMTKTARKKAKDRKKAQAGSREFHGVLKEFDAQKGTLTLTVQNKDGEDDIVLERKNIAMIRLSLDF